MSVVGEYSASAPQAPNSIPPNTSPLRVGNFQLGKTIGVGSFGKVKIAEHVVTGHKVAVKILNRKKIRTLRMDLKVRREITNMKLFRHPHIIRLYEVIETPTDIFMVMEYVSGGELFDYIVANGKLSEDDARRFFQQIISGVEYCHSHMVVHRDLKPENLLIDVKNNCIKIADFGLSTMMHDGDFLKTSCGSPNYAAPEVISGKLYAGPEVDVWSCGVILYTLLCARLPFDDEFLPSLFNKIRAGKFDIPSHITPSCKDLLKSMLETDPLRRITIAEIRTHPWFIVNLPKYLEYAPVVSTRLLENPDQDIVDEIVQKFGSDHKTVQEALQQGEKTGRVNEFIVAYNLVYDNKKLYSEKILSASNAEAAQMLSTSPSFNLRDEPPFDLEDFTVTAGELPNSPVYSPGSSPTPQRNGFTRAKFVKRMWYLGIMSVGDPNSIMQQVFQSLKTLGFVWKIVAPYQLRCKYEPDERKSVKIALQLYKVKDQRYLLDIKKLSGETFPFFDACSKLLNSLL